MNRRVTICRLRSLRFRPGGSFQRSFAFIDDWRRREASFKRLVLASTILLSVLMVASVPRARAGTRLLFLRGYTLLVGRLGFFPRHEDAESLRQARREAEIASARTGLAEAIRPGSSMDAFLKAAGMDAKLGLIRWGNFDRTLLLSSQVFEPDHAGRSYRMKPHYRSVWVIGLSLNRVLGLFLIPDSPPVREAAGRAGGFVVSESIQNTNSWGCRGPEPNLCAPVRIMVLGDSMMQGALLGDEQTPPQQLRRYLEDELACEVSVLNTGHLGYSTEQYFHTLREFEKSFAPHFVVLSFCSNDFGDMTCEANWRETEAWLDGITDLQRRGRWHLLVVPAPSEQDLLGLRQVHLFPGRLTRIFKDQGREYFDPLDQFTDEQIRLQNEEVRHRLPLSSPLYNLHLMGDRHFSPRGADFWGKLVAARLLLVWDSLVLDGQPAPEAIVRHAWKGKRPPDQPESRQ